MWVVRVRVHLVANGVGDRGGAVVDRLQIEAGLLRAAIPQAEHDDAAHQVGGAVRTGAPHLPFGPDFGTVDGVGKNLCAHIRDGAEDLLPVGADLAIALEAPTGVGGGQVLVVSGEAVDECVEVMGIGRRRQSDQEGVRTVGHGRSFRYS